MASNIDPTKPTAGTALTADVRANFAHAKGEIEDLQSGSGIFALSWSVLTGTPTTLSGYGITDAVASSTKGQANGVAELDGSGKVPASQMTVSAVEYKGTWNADTNTPDIGASSPQQGDLYRVTTAGTTSLSGIDDWEVGDLAVFNGTSWDKWDTTTKLEDDPAPVLAADLDPNGFGIDGPVPKARAGYNAQTGTSYTTTAADVNGIVKCTNGSAITLTLHAASQGAVISIIQGGTGKVTINVASGDKRAPNGDRTAVQYSIATCIRGDGEWFIAGDVEP